jgi:hypothetical protein
MALTQWHCFAHENIFFASVVMALPPWGKALACYSLYKDVESSDSSCLELMCAYQSFSEAYQIFLLDMFEFDHLC